ncbi:hypothetical protein HC752_21855 [Vibrio sp. S9_S30]|uniref:hypothetical protein n=1 Tax=Vibrio sp. S9_S30 TaxID=2720226 RepID=UPI001680D575|nr:hypothetical protein [Vibrio sp. S9_S30]MBD1559592.1 hypothetical protein [Vibrio sp. S9_S30]
MKEAIYLTHEHPLLKPISGREFITVTPPTYGQFIDSDANPQGEVFTDAEKEALVTLCTGLTEDELNQLSEPDWKTLFDYSHGFYFKAGHQLAGVSRKDNEQHVVLYFSDQKKVTFELPTLGVTKMANKLKDPIQKTAFILEQVTDLDEAELRDLPLPDHNELNLAVNVFLTEPAAYFQ